MIQKTVLNFECRNYRSLIIAGLGAIGQGVLVLGEEIFKTFDYIIGIDIEPSMCQYASGLANHEMVSADIRQPAFLSDLLAEFPNPVLFINLCSGIDTVRLRKQLQAESVGYLDVCESYIEDDLSGRFSISMPYTNQACHGKYPHLICQGINPGMVEYVARKIMQQMAPARTGFRVSIFENDQLALSGSHDISIVSWSPADLIEEMMSPSMEYVSGGILENSTPSTRHVMTQWEGRLVPARLVGHEDIWNLGQLPGVSDARFFYALHQRIMETLCDTSVDAEVLKCLRLPRPYEHIEGLERIVVTVDHPSTQQYQAFSWQTDHAQTQKRYGINAVQYQTAKSVLLSMMLMQHTDIGRRKGTFNASELPLDNAGWSVLDTLMEMLGIDFVSVAPGHVCCPTDKTGHPKFQYT